MKKGELYLIPLCKLRLLPEHVKIRLLITRSERKITGVTWYPQLAPSIALFKTYLFKWKNGKVKNWWSLYIKRFAEEIVQEPKKSAMKKLYNYLIKGNDIAIVCFCTNRQCHRYIIGNIMKAAGIKVHEIL